VIRVLHKAFDMLEYLDADPRQCRKLNEIAGHLKMNAGTCANILQTMVRRKYVDQVKVRGGYLLGPMIYYLSRLSAYRGDLVLAAEPLMADLVRQVNETVLLVILRGNERFIILQIDGNQNIQVGRDLFQQDKIYQTATGRLLLAHFDRKDFNDFIAANGLPGSAWPGVSSRSKLESALEAIRRQGWVSHQAAGDVTGLARPICEKNKVIAALGLFLPSFRFKGDHKAAIMKGMAQASSAISARLAGDGIHGVPSADQPARPGQRRPKRLGQCAPKKNIS